MHTKTPMMLSTADAEIKKQALDKEGTKCIVKEFRFWNEFARKPRYVHCLIRNVESITCYIPSTKTLILRDNGSWA